MNAKHVRRKREPQQIWKKMLSALLKKWNGIQGLSDPCFLYFNGPDLYELCSSSLHGGDVMNIMTEPE